MPDAQSVAKKQPAPSGRSAVADGVCVPDSDCAADADCAADTERVAAPLPDATADVVVVAVLDVLALGLRDGVGDEVSGGVPSAGQCPSAVT